MIRLNNKDYPWQEGMTVRSLLDEKQFTFRHIIVRINGVYVPEDQYSQVAIQDQDQVLVIHLIAGG